VVAGLAIALALWGLAAFAFNIAAQNAVRAGERERRARPGGPPPGSWPSITLLRPCQGLDEELEENLVASATAAYHGDREVLVLVPTADDPAHVLATRAAERVRAAAPRVSFQVVVTEIATRGNRKVAQLAVGERRARGAVLVVVDSDVRLDDDTLPSLLGALGHDPKAGMASAAYRERPGSTLADSASAALLSSTPHAFHCLSALQDRAGAAHVPAGGLLAIPRSTLAEVGGFGSLEDLLGEDAELARRLHARGYTIPIAQAPANITDRGRTLRSVVGRFSRWAIMTRRQRPLLFPSYFLFFACTPLQLAAATAIAASGSPFALPALEAVALATFARLLLARRLRQVYEVDARLGPTASALFLGELLILASALLALGPPVVEWRGRRFRVGPGGTLAPLG
jgi:ceramide glucosyltransferase